MEFLEKNREVLEERFVDVLRILDDEENTVSPVAVETVEARDGNHALTVEKDGEKYRLNSAYRPLSEAEKWANQFEVQNIDINVFMFGFGNGIFVRELLRRMAPDGKLYVFEPSWEIFGKVVGEEDIADILSDTRFYILMGNQGIADLKGIMHHIVGWHNISTQISCSHIGYDRLFPEMCTKFWDTVEYQNALARVKRDTNAHFAHISVENTFQNIRYIKDSNYITEMIGKIPEEVPGIIVAAGPSLDKNIELLKEVHGKAFVIAVDTAVKILEERKIPYDCVITVDPGKPAWYLTNFSGCREKPLFCCMESSGDIMSFHRGRKIWLENSIYLEGLYFKYGMFFPEHIVGGSVATSAFVLAKHLGLKNIVLVGQDLAYDGERTHAGGHDNHIMDEERTMRMVEGIDGGQVMTRGDWTIFLNWYEDMIKKYPELNVIDATEGGALIHGSKVMPLSQVLDEYCQGIEFSFDRMLEDLKPTFQAADYEPIRRELLSLGKGIKNIRSKSRDGIKFAEEFIQAGRNISAKKHDRLLKEIRKANNFISKQHGYDLLDVYSSELTKSGLENVNRITGDVYTDEENTVKAALTVYQAMVEAVDTVEDMVQESLAHI